MKYLIKGEFFKLRKSKGVKLLLILILISSIIFCCYYKICMLKKTDISNNVTGSSIFYSLLAGVVYENFIASILAAIFISKDFENKTINMTFTYGYSKTKIILSKLIVYLLSSIIIIYIFILSSTILFSIFFTFGEKFTMYFLVISFKCIVANILGIITISSITFTIAILTRNSIFTIISPIIIFFIYMCIGAVHNPIVANLLPFDLVINALINHVNFIDVLKLIISCTLTVLICIYTSSYYFKKLEFK